MPAYFWKKLSLNLKVLLFPNEVSIVLEQELFLEIIGIKASHCVRLLSHTGHRSALCAVVALLPPNRHTKPVSYLKWGSFGPYWEFLQLQWTNLCLGWYKRILNQLQGDFCVNDDPKYGTWSYVCKRQSRYRSVSKDPRKSS